MTTRSPSSPWISPIAATAGQSHPRRLHHRHDRRRETLGGAGRRLWAARIRPLQRCAPRQHPGLGWRQSPATHHPGHPQRWSVLVHPRLEVASVLRKSFLSSILSSSATPDVPLGQPSIEFLRAQIWGLTCGFPLPLLRELLPLVLLVVVLGPVEAAERLDRGVGPADHRLDAGLRLLRRAALLLRAVEDRRTVLRRVRGVTGVVAAPEHVEQLVVTDDRRGVVDLDRLGMVAEPMVCPIRPRAARVADTRPDDSGKTPEPGVG